MTLKIDNHILAYLDILGFRERISSEKGRSKLHESIKSLHKVFSPNRRMGSNASVVQFSDCIVISTKVAKPADMENFLFQLAEGLATLLESDTVVRGAITYGLHFYDGRAMISPAMVKAYELERDYAKYPRVIIDPAFEGCIVPDLKHTPGEKFILGLYELTKTDTDGFKFLDYLGVRKRYLRSFSENAEYVEESTTSPVPEEDWFRFHKEVIESNLRNSSAPGVMSKYIWLANYYNQFIRLRSGFAKEIVDNLLIEDTQLAFGVWAPTTGNESRI